MSARAKRVIIFGPLILPAVVTICWLASGHEVFTKSGKYLNVPVRNELFGDTDIQVQFVPGPLLGYYIGLDLVIVTLLVALFAGLVAWLILRRRRRHEGLQHEKPAFGV